MKKLVFIILLLVANNSFAQNKTNKIIDSLKIELKKTKIDTVKINILNEMCSHNFYQNPLIGLGYSEIALDLSKKIKWKKGIAVAYNHLGVCYWINKKLVKSIDCFQKSLIYYKELKDQANIADIYNHLGTVYGETNNHKQALHYYNTAYRINTKINNVLQTANDLTGMADIHFKIGNHQKAINYYVIANQKYAAVLNIFGIGLTSFNIGKIYVIQKKYSKALEYYNKALDKFTASKSVYHLGSVYLEIGKAHYIFSFDNKREKRNKLNLAIKNLKKAIQFYSKNNSFDQVNECNIELSKTYEEIGEYKLALDTYKEYVKLEKTVLNYAKENRLTELKTQREFEIKNSQIQTQELKIKSDRRKVLLLITISISIAILLTLFLWLYISKRKTNQLLLEKNQEISNINKQKDKFFSIIAHDLRGPFGGFLGLTELLAEDIDSMNKEDIQFAAANMKSSAHNLNRLLDNLLEWSRMEQGLVPFSPKKHNLLKAVKESTATLQNAADKKNIRIETAIDDSSKIYADYHILQSVIRNILANAIKFTPREGNIKIQGKEETNYTIISICDTGIGMDAKMLENIFQLDVKNNRKGTEDEPSSGLGLILCKEFIEKHRGKIWIESEVNKGSCFYFSFPNANIN
nr:tetratricopeptide repeat protein [uncultured Flavobacterium sp.]